MRLLMLVLMFMGCVALYPHFRENWPLLIGDLRQLVHEEYHGAER